jgi:hypothetical protein
MRQQSLQEDRFNRLPQRFSNEEKGYCNSKKISSGTIELEIKKIKFLI